MKPTTTHPDVYDSATRTVPILLLLLAACGASTDVDSPERHGAPANAEPIAIDGGTVYLADGSIYGPCTLIDPHTDDLAAWLDRTPDASYADFGFVCTD